MLGAYLPILVMLLAALAISIVMVGGSFVLGPKRATRFKGDTYESGMAPIGSARERFPVHFYLVAMLFILFDIETVFLYPWTVIFRNPALSYDRASKMFLLCEMGVFVAILVFGYVYLYCKGAFEWSTDQEADRLRNKVIFKPRPPILFGNENSGTVMLSTDQVSDNDKAVVAPMPFGKTR